MESHAVLQKEAPKRGLSFARAEKAIGQPSLGEGCPGTGGLPTMVEQLVGRPRCSDAAPAPNNLGIPRRKKGKNKGARAAHPKASKRKEGR